MKKITKLITQAVDTTEGCQRNWNYDHLIPDDHINTIVHTAVTMPTKQNQDFYSLIVSNDRDFNYAFYLNTFVDEEGLDNEGRNAQTNSPLLLIWIKNESYVTQENSYEGSAAMNIGVSAGATALAANMLGYRTGFCRCINEILTIPLLKKYNIITSKVELALGIGIPDPNMPDRNYVKFPDGIKRFGKKTKKIKVYSI